MTWLDELRELAAKATPGPYRIHGDPDYPLPQIHAGEKIVAEMRYGSPRNAPYFAGCTPERIAALVAVAEAAAKVMTSEAGGFAALMDEVERLGIKKPSELPLDTVSGFLTDKSDPLGDAFDELREALSKLEDTP